MKTIFSFFIVLFVVLVIRSNIPPIRLTPDIQLIKMTSSGQFNVNDRDGLSSTIDFFMSTFRVKPFAVRIVQTVTPKNGLKLSPLLNGTEYKFSQSTFEKLKQGVSASIPGDYAVTTTATIVETGQSVSEVVKFKVLPIGTPNLNMASPNIHLEPAFIGKPVVLKPNTVTKVAFGMSSVSGKDYDKVIGMTVIEPKRNIKVELNDAGLGTDTEANDRVYGSEFIDINSAGMNSGECMNFYTIVHTTMGDVNSRGQDLCVSALGLGGYVHHEDDWIGDGEVKFARNVINVKIRKGTTDERIQQIAASVGCTVVGGHLNFGDFVFKLNQIPLASEAEKVIMQKRKQLMLLPEVETADFDILLKMGFRF
jgi:hypothetical protein